MPRQILGYSNAGGTARPTRGFGYFALYTINWISLLAGMLIFVIEISGDSFARVFSLYVGIPVLFGQIVLAAVPSFVHIYSNRGAATPSLLFKWLTVVPPVLGMLGVLLAFVIPAKGGSS
jgi:hypothetical protein